MSILKKLIENMSKDELSELSDLLKKPEPKKTKKSFRDRQEEHEPCRLCTKNLGDKHCCGVKAATKVFNAFEKEKIPRGPGRVAGMQRARELQAAKGWSGPFFGADMIEEAVRVAKEHTETVSKKKRKSK